MLLLLDKAFAEEVEKELQAKGEAKKEDLISIASEKGYEITEEDLKAFIEEQSEELS